MKALFDTSEPLNVLKSHLDKSIAGQDKQKLSAFCLSLTYKTKNPANILPIGRSSAGKTHLMENVLSYFPVIQYPHQLKDDDLDSIWDNYQGIVLNGITAKALVRYGDKGFSWDNKILGISELDSTTSASPILRSLASEGGGFALATEKKDSGAMYTKLWSPKGRPLIFACTASEEIEHQFANRCVMLEIGRTNLKDVHKKIAGQYNGVNKKTTPFQIQTQQDIFDLQIFANVKVPFAEHVSDYWYKHNVVSNRTLHDFFRLMQGIAILHHKDRKMVKGLLIAEPADFDLARQVYCSQTSKLSAPRLDTLHTLTELEVVDPVSRSTLKGECIGFTLEELAESAMKSTTAVYKDLQALRDEGLVNRRKWSQDDNKGREPYLYYRSEFSKRQQGQLIPTWIEMTGKKLKGSYDITNIGD